MLFPVLTHRYISEEISHCIPFSASFKFKVPGVFQDHPNMKFTSHHVKAFDYLVQLKFLYHSGVIKLALSEDILSLQQNINSYPITNTVLSTQELTGMFFLQCHSYLLFFFLNKNH